MSKGKVAPRRRAGSDSKHDRKGLKTNRIYTKKGGAGGSFTWGLPGDERYLPDIAKGDINYNSEEDDVYFLVSSDNVNPETVHDYSYLVQESEDFSSPVLELNDFKLKVVKDIKELFNTSNFPEFVVRVRQHQSVLLHYALVKKLLEMAMEHTDHEREIASRAMTELQLSGLLPFTQIAKAFEKLFQSIGDLSLDIPSAPKLLAQFLARCVADDVLPPGFLMDKHIQSLAKPIIRHSKVLLSMKHGIGRLERVWGVNISSSVEELKLEMKNIIAEYLNSADSGEVKQLLKKMNVPFFHHEFVKRSVLMALEKREREQAMISVLLKKMVDSEVISTKQLELGFQRLFQEVEDIKLDNPDAPLLLDIFAKQSIKDGCLTADRLDYIKKIGALVAKRESKLLEQEFSQVSRTRVGSAD